MAQSRKAPESRKYEKIPKTKKRKKSGWQRRTKRTLPPPKENLLEPQRQTFQAGGRYKNPIKTREAISTTEIFPHFFPAKKSSSLELGGVCFLFPGLAPENTKTKYRKKTKMAKKVPFVYVFGVFFVFVGANPGWGIWYFFA